MWTVTSVVVTILWQRPLWSNSWNNWPFCFFVELYKVYHLNFGDWNLNRFKNNFSFLLDLVIKHKNKFTANAWDIYWLLENNNHLQKLGDVCNIPIQRWTHREIIMREYCNVCESIVRFSYEYSILMIKRLRKNCWLFPWNNYQSWYWILKTRTAICISSLKITDWKSILLIHPTGFELQFLQRTWNFHGMVITSLPRLAIVWKKID